MEWESEGLFQDNFPNTILATQHTFKPIGSDRIGSDGTIKILKNLTYSSSFQKKLLHNRLLQGMLGRIIVNGRDGEDPNVDQATPWGRSRGLGDS
ncbi:hypothetical protein HZH68_002011 [Vespula germanica]|uniref:Uncharacterized protein n=1 Tax=Vespula germanica TaxID=30212 RepID=A0A834NL51_VESGE|nr:hypothetical protein HZH68_002011 [Vespula germanica]